MSIPFIPNNNTGIPDITINGTGIPLIGNYTVGVRGVYVSNIRNVNIHDTRDWVVNPPNAVPIDVPVTVYAGTPIVNMPGCVTVHKENAKKDPSTNKNLVNDDPKQNVVLCDGGMPYFHPPDYEANQLSWDTIYGEAPTVDSGIDVGDIPKGNSP